MPLPNTTAYSALLREFVETLFSDFTKMLELLMQHKRENFHEYDNIILSVKTIAKPDGSFNLRVESAPYFIVDDTSVSHDIEAFLKMGIDAKEILSGKLKNKNY